MIFNDFNFKSISVNEGLSQNTVNCILQDSKGFLWFGTQQGLNKYDGFKFTIYKNDPSDNNSLLNNYIYSIFEDSGNCLWVGSLNGVISRYNSEDDNFTNFSFEQNDSEPGAGSIISCFCEDDSGNLNIGTLGMGIKIFEKKNERFIQTVLGEMENESGKGNSIVTSVKIDDSGMLWAGTWDEGLMRYDLTNKKIENHIYLEGDQKSLSNNRVRFIFPDSRKILWIGTSDGLNKYDPVNNNFKRYHPATEKINVPGANVMTCMCEDRTNNLWIGTNNSELIRFNEAENILTSIPLDNEAEKDTGVCKIVSIYSDRSNVLWAGTFTKGLLKLDCERKKFYKAGNIVRNDKEKLNRSIHSILKDSRNNIWLGSDSSILIRINTDGNRIENFKKELSCDGQIKNETVMCLFEDENAIWIGTLLKGLSRYDKNLNKIEHFSYHEKNKENPVYSICKFANDNNSLWIGTRKFGLLKFDKIKKEFIEYSSLRKFNQDLESREIKCLLTDRSEILWIGTDTGGLSSLDFDKGLITNYLYDKNKTDTLSDNYVISLCEDTKENIWIGTMNGGLNKFNKEKKNFTRYTTAEGLPDNTIRGILEDEENNLWLSTNNGVSKFNTANKTFRNYDVSDGLQSKEFNDRAFYKADDGTMYFGGVNGFNFFKPCEILGNPYIPCVEITDFLIFNHSIKNSHENPFLKKNITETDGITLSYRESVFSFEFSSLSFNNPEKNQYAYMMDGFDKEWIYCGNRRFVTYTNLEPGEYTFKVRGSNNDGIWNEAGTSLKIRITPPFWKTWWFKSLGVMSIAGATGMAYRQKLTKIEKEKKIQEEFSRRLLDSQEQERKKIASDLHDTIAHDILITKNKAVIGLKNTENPDEMKSILNEISDLASNALNDVRGISYSLHPHQIERLGLTKAIKSIVNRVSKSTDINFTVNMDDIDKTLPKELEINVFRIIQECFNNIMKHSGATKSMLKIARSDNSLNIIITDNGKGFSKIENHGLGLRGIKERIKLYNGTLNIESEPGKGTSINIIIPFK